MKKLTRSQPRTAAEARSGLAWTGADRMRLQLMAEQQIPAEAIARKLRRSEASVRTEARRQRVTLAPAAKQLELTEKRPYGGKRFEPRRSLANASAPGRPPRSRATSAADPARNAVPAQRESLF